jgi:hypothetical protein
METKVLLRLIKDDIKLLDEINGSFIFSETLTTDEVEVALTRAKSLAMEFEMLSKNVAQLHDACTEPDVMFKSRVKEHAGMIQKEAEIFNGESELIDLQEEEDTKPMIEKIIQKPGVDEIPFTENMTQTEMADTGKTSEKQAGSFIQDGLLTGTEVNEKSTQGEMVDDKVQPLNDLLSQERGESSFEGIPLKNIQDGIGINDRFLFIRELFGNDSEKYEKTIAALNDLNTIGEAVNYLKQNFKWNKTEGSQKFLALVKRRFTK